MPSWPAQGEYASTTYFVTDDPDPRTIISHVEGEVAEVASQLGVEPRKFAATAGEDFELCVCMPAEAVDVESGVELTWVGRVLEGVPGIVFTDGAGELAGYEHDF